MKINSIKLANILSFGQEQNLRAFSDFNLFIGKNGSGKTNVLRLLGNLNISLENVENNSCVQNNTQELFTAYLDLSYKKRNSPQDESYLEVEYDVSQGSYFYKDNPKKNIVFKERDFKIKLEKGDIAKFKNQIIILDQYIPDNIFFKSLTELGKKSINLKILNEGLCYIFDRSIGFLPNGSFLEVNNKHTNNPEFDYTKLPSGFINCAKILTQIILNCKPQHGILLVDEPELHLEARRCRRFVNFLFYLHVKDSHNEREKENIYYEIRKLLDAIINTFPKKYQEIIFPISKTYEQAWHFKQIFMASHSSVILNEFLKKNKLTSVYEFDIDRSGEKQLNDELLSPENSKGLFSIVRKIDLNEHSILDNLGCEGSDLLQTNGVVWVEGPSDIVYIRKWLEMYARDEYKKEFIQGSNYEFQMFAGTLLNSLYLTQDLNESQQKEEYKKLVSMFSFSRNAFLVMDSDAIMKDEELTDKSTFAKAKNYIKNQFEEKNKAKVGYKLGLWYKQGDIKVTTIEDYLDQDSRQFYNPNKKLDSALKITKYWTCQNFQLSAFEEHNLKHEIEILYNHIELWNE